MVKISDADHVRADGPVQVGIRNHRSSRTAPSALRLIPTLETIRNLPVSGRSDLRQGHGDTFDRRFGPFRIPEDFGRLYFII